MMTRSPNRIWSSKAIPAFGVVRGVPGAAEIRKLPTGYEIESSSSVLLLRASAARRARWAPLSGKVRRSRALPTENIAAKSLLESWLTKDVQEQTESWTRLERALEENRSSDRTLFS